MPAAVLATTETLSTALLSGEVTGSTIVTGGHYMVSNKYNLNEGTIAAFNDAVQTYLLLEQNGLSAALGVYVNDIGLTCSGGDSCSIAQMKLMSDSSLPDEYLDILRENNIDPKDVVIIYERFIRNRAKRIFHQERKRNPAIVEREAGFYYVPKDRPEFILTRKNALDKYGTPACPLIMAAYGLELKRMGYKNSINFYYVGDDNLSNIPNYLPVEKGKLMAHDIDESIITENVYLD